MADRLAELEAELAEARDFIRHLGFGPDALKSVTTLSLGVLQARLHLKWILGWAKADGSKALLTNVDLALKALSALTPQAVLSSEALARRFHETYERLAPSFGYETRKDSAVPWEQVPERNRKLMIAVCTELEGDVGERQLLRTEIGFLRSCIRSGESLSPEDDARIDALLGPRTREATNGAGAGEGLSQGAGAADQPPQQGERQQHSGLHTGELPRDVAGGVRQDGDGAGELVRADADAGSSADDLPAEEVARTAVPLLDHKYQPHAHWTARDECDRKVDSGPDTLGYLCGRPRKEHPE